MFDIVDQKNASPAACDGPGGPLRRLPFRWAWGPSLIFATAPPPTRRMRRLFSESGQGTLGHPSPLDVILRWAWGPSLIFETTHLRPPGCVRLFSESGQGTLGRPTGNGPSPLDVIPRWAWVLRSS